MMLIVMSCIVKCVIIVIRCQQSSTGTLWSAGPFRGISLLWLAPVAVSPPQLLWIWAPQTSTQMSQLSPSLKKPQTKKISFFLFLLCHLAALIISLVTSPTNVCVFFWWLFVPESPFSSFHHRFPWPSPKHQILTLSKKLPTTPGKMSWKLKS